MDKNTLSQNERILIAQIKLQEKVTAQEELLNNISSQRDQETEAHSTIYEPNDDYSNLKSENILLRQLNEEMKAKNLILKELLTIKNEKSVSVKTNADITNNMNTKSQRIPTITIKKKNSEDNISAYQYVSHYLAKDKSLKIRRIISARNGLVHVKCDDAQNAENVEQVLMHTISSKFDIEKKKIKNPRMKIVDIENNLKMNLQELESDINNRNFADLDSKCKAIHTYTNDRNNTQSVIIEVTSEIYSRIKENKDKIFIGHQCLHVYDDLNIKLCFKCGRFGHSAKKMYQWQCMYNMCTKPYG